MRAATRSCAGSSPPGRSSISSTADLGRRSGSCRYERSLEWSLLGGAVGPRLLVLFLASGTILHAIFETQARYHYALEPAVLVLAAVAIDRSTSSR
jgi:hypothetical protein